MHSRTVQTLLLAALLLLSTAHAASAKFYLADEQDELKFSSVEQADFELPRIGYSDSDIRLSEFSRGYYTAVAFFTTTCPLGDLQLPSFQNFHESTGAGGDEERKIPARALGVAIDPMGEREVQPYLEEQELTFPVVFDPMAQDTGETYQLEEMGLPLVVLFDPEGNLVGYFQGVEKDLAGEIWEWINLHHSPDRDGEEAGSA